MPTPLNPHIDLAGPEGASNMVGQGVRDLNEEKWRQLQYGLENRKLKLAENESSSARIAQKYEQKYGESGRGHRGGNYNPLANKGGGRGSKIDADTLEKMLKLTELYPDAGDFYDEETGEFKVDEKAVRKMQEERLAEKRANAVARDQDRELARVTGEFEKRRLGANATAAETARDRADYEFNELKTLEQNRLNTSNALAKEAEARAKSAELEEQFNRRTLENRVLREESERKRAEAEAELSQARVEAVEAQTAESKENLKILKSRADEAAFTLDRLKKGGLSPEDQAKLTMDHFDNIIAMARAVEESISEKIATETAGLRAAAEGILVQLSEPLLGDDERADLNDQLQDIYDKTGRIAGRIRKEGASGEFKKVQDMLETFDPERGYSTKPRPFAQKSENRLNAAIQEATDERTGVVDAELALGLLQMDLEDPSATEADRKAIKEAIQKLESGQYQDVLQKPSQTPQTGQRGGGATNMQQVEPPPPPVEQTEPQQQQPAQQQPAQQPQERDRYKSYNDTTAAIDRFAQLAPEDAAMRFAGADGYNPSTSPVPGTTRPTWGKYNSWMADLIDNQYDGNVEGALLQIRDQMNMSDQDVIDFFARTWAIPLPDEIDAGIDRVKQEAGNRFMDDNEAKARYAQELIQRNGIPASIAVWIATKGEISAYDDPNRKGRTSSQITGHLPEKEKNLVKSEADPMMEFRARDEFEADRRRRMGRDPGEDRGLYRGYGRKGGQPDAAGNELPPTQYELPGEFNRWPVEAIQEGIEDILTQGDRESMVRAREPGFTEEEWAKGKASQERAQRRAARRGEPSSRVKANLASKRARKAEEIRLRELPTNGMEDEARKIYANGADPAAVEMFTNELRRRGASDQIVFYFESMARDGFFGNLDKEKWSKFYDKRGSGEKIDDQLAAWRREGEK